MKQPSFTFLDIIFPHMKSGIDKHKALYIIFLAMLAATPPLSTDMYLAAIPQIAELWNIGKD